MLLTRKSEGAAQAVNPLFRAASALGAKTVDRRTFLRGSGIAAGAAAFASQLPLNLVGEAHAPAKKPRNTVVKRTACTHCSAGCALDAVVTNTWGYGAMTNSYNDLQNTKCMFFIGSNAAEAHPVSMLHALHAKETGAKMIVADPRFTRTAAKADQYIRFRSGTDVALLFGMLYHVFKNGWEDQKYIDARVYGMDKVRDEEMTKWTPDKVTEVTGVPEAEGYAATETFAKNRPSTIIWCMGQTQHTTSNAFVRASCILQLALGNIGVSGGGANIN